MTAGRLGGGGAPPSSTLGRNSRSDMLPFFLAWGKGKKRGGQREERNLESELTCVCVVTRETVTCDSNTTAVSVERPDVWWRWLLGLLGFGRLFARRANGEVEVVAGFLQRPQTQQKRAKNTLVLKRSNY